MKRNQYVTSELPETKVKILIMTMSFITLIVIAHIGFWIWQLDRYNIQEPIEFSLHCITFYLNCSDLK
jgi:hypothetical protein